MYEVSAEARVGKITAASRTVLKGKKFIPAVLYDRDGTAQNIALSKKEADTLIKKRGTSGMVKLSIQNGDSTESHEAVFKNPQYNYLQSDLLHLDFQKTYADTKIRIKIPIKGTGTPYGVLRQGGVLQQNAQESEITCLPGSIPDCITVDVSHLKINEIVRAQDLEGFEFRVPSQSFFTVASSRVARKIAATGETEE
ncbi:50S ribosomal protein L25 [bacterium]|jgi:large subunit ribosomal protein L25|nr:50S ribosomal protein L25 [bacterium]